jgi:hypothetical protein
MRYPDTRYPDGCIESVGHRESEKWSIGGMNLSEFHREKFEYWTSVFANTQSPKSRWDRGPLKGQLTCASAFRRIGHRGLEK